MRKQRDMTIIFKPGVEVLQAKRSAFHNANSRLYRNCEGLHVDARGGVSRDGDRRFSRRAAEQYEHQGAVQPSRVSIPMVRYYLGLVARAV